MAEKKLLLGEVVVIGYGTVKKSHLMQRNAIIDLIRKDDSRMSVEQGKRGVG